MKTILFVSLTIAVAGFINENFLIGRWQSQPSPTGKVTTVVFRPDNTFEGFINRKPLVTGKYTVKDSVMTFTDNGCGGSEAAYKLVLFSNGDSLLFQPIYDTCTDRRNGMSRLVLGREK